jgi:hypothetical protein
MVLVDSTFVAHEALRRRFESAQKHGRIKRSLKFRPACRQLGARRDNLFEMLCLGAHKRVLARPKPELFRPVITGSLRVPRLRRRSK